jgi:hypothetical protein
MVKLRRSKTDSETIEIYSERGDKTILWAIAHEDILSEFDGETISNNVEDWGNDFEVQIRSFVINAV